MVHLSLGYAEQWTVRSVQFIAFLLLLGAMHSVYLNAQWSSDPVINNIICVAPNNQDSPKMVSDGASGAIITWCDNRSGTTSGIYAQRVNEYGVTQWTANGAAICTTTSNQLLPQIVSDGLGGAIITWEDFRSGNYKIYAQRINASGYIQWTANGVAILPYTSGDQLHHQVTSDGAGGAIITWEDNRSGSNDIYAQQVSAYGVPQWESDVAICSASGNQSTPQIASYETGGAFITWVDNRNGTMNSDIYAQRIYTNGGIAWVPNGVGICTAIGNQYDLQMISGGGGNAIITWTDERSQLHEDSDIYAQSVNAAGIVQWPVDGVLICNAYDIQDNPQLVNDGLGGAILTWTDMRRHPIADIYAQRVDQSGVAQWTSNGVVICNADYNKKGPQLVAAKQGGAIIVWKDNRRAVEGIFAQYVNAKGAIQWTINGIPISFGNTSQAFPQIISDGSTGVIITWEDMRNGEDFDIFAQNVDLSGHLGRYPPSIVDVQDNINDQGGRVLLFWDHSHLDALPISLINGYEIYRGLPASLANSIYSAIKATMYRNQKAANFVMPIYITNGTATDAGEPIYWEFVADFPAKKLEHYLAIVPTPSDSGPQGNSQYYYMIRAYNSPTVYWDSHPDSGYSVDNLPPIGVGTLATRLLPDSTVSIHWQANTRDPDIGCYHVYRSTTSGFAPDKSTRLSTCIDTTFIDTAPPASPTVFYRVAAQDIHGNTGKPSFEVSVSLIVTSAPEEVGLPQEFALEQNYPNPFNPSTTIRYALPVAAHVRLEVYNTVGVRVAILANRNEDAGVKTAEFNASGLASGIYFCRLQAGTFTAAKKLILLR